MLPSASLSLVSYISPVFYFSVHDFNDYPWNIVLSMQHDGINTTSAVTEDPRIPPSKVYQFSLKFNIQFLIFQDKLPNWIELCGLLKMFFKCQQSSPQLLLDSLANISFQIEWSYVKIFKVKTKHPFSFRNVVLVLLSSSILQHKLHEKLLKCEIRWSEQVLQCFYRSKCWTK